jgi:hypothetical protein
MSEVRQTVLERLFGKQSADATRKGLRDAADILDRLGVERKSLDQDAVKALAAKIATAVKDNEDDIEDILVNELTDALQIDSTGEPAAESVEEAEDADEIEEDEDDEDVDGEAVIKALNDYTVTVTKDMGEIGKAQIAQAEEIGNIFKALGALLERVEAVEDKTNSRPRQASKADETVLPEGDGDDPISQIKKQLGVGQNGDGETFMGLKVTHQPE